MTLCLPLRQWPTKAVLLGLKKRGFGQGKYTGFGGKVLDGESIVAAARRELAEECGLVAESADLNTVGVITFCFPAQPAWTQCVNLFLVRRWSGAPQESDEMAPAWFELDQLPYSQMWQDAHHWLPHVLDGQTLTLSIFFAADHETIDQVIYE